jgi:hypothetical protein
MSVEARRICQCISPSFEADGEASISWPSLRSSLISSFQEAATFFGSSDEFFGQPVDNGVDEAVVLDEFLGL